MSQQQAKKNLFHESLSKQIAEQIKLGTASWLKPQDNEHIDLPYNPVTGIFFSMLLRFNLVLHNMKQYTASH